MIVSVACHCGNSDRLVRDKLRKFGYAEAATIEILKGKDKSFSLLNSIPQFPEVEEITNHIRNSTKFAILIGYNENMMRWVDLANGQYVKNDVDAELLVKHFA